MILSEEHIAKIKKAVEEKLKKELVDLGASPGLMLDVSRVHKVISENDTDVIEEFFLDDKSLFISVVRWTGKGIEHYLMPSPKHEGMN